MSAISPHNIKNNIGLRLTDKNPGAARISLVTVIFFVISRIREHQKGFFDRLEIGTPNPLSSCERHGAKKKRVLRGRRSHLSTPSLAAAATKMSLSRAEPPHNGLHM